VDAAVAADAAAAADGGDNPETRTEERLK